MPMDRRGVRAGSRKPDWILDRRVGCDEVWRKPDWNRVHYQKPYYRIRCGAPWKGISLDTEDPMEVEAILRVMGLLRHAELSQGFRHWFWEENQRWRVEALQPSLQESLIAQANKRRVHDSA
jgi:hypothetical protein